jgi:hypothetical protein
VPWFRRLGACLSSKRLEFNSMRVHVGIFREESGTGRDFSPSSSSLPCVQGNEISVKWILTKASHQKKFYYSRFNWSEVSDDQVVHSQTWNVNCSLWQLSVVLLLMKLHLTPPAESSGAFHRLVICLKAAVPHASVWIYTQRHFTGLHWWLLVLQWTIRKICSVALYAIEFNYLQPQICPRAASFDIVSFRQCGHSNRFQLLYAGGRKCGAICESPSVQA